MSSSNFTLIYSTTLICLYFITGCTHALSVHLDQPPLHTRKCVIYYLHKTLRNKVFKLEIELSKLVLFQAHGELVPMELSKS
jgi:hypothetical protein